MNKKLAKQLVELQQETTKRGDYAPVLSLPQSPPQLAGYKALETERDSALVDKCNAEKALAEALLSCAEKSSALQEEIEDLNILGATQVAMRRAVEQVFSSARISPHEPDPLFEAITVADTNESTLAHWLIVVDGKPMKKMGYPHRAFVQGDSRSLCIAMASIIAKVARDRTMLALDCEYPQYDFGSSKGYATPLHREAIKSLGPTPIHRPLFLRKILEEDPRGTSHRFAPRREHEQPLAPLGPSGW